MRPQVEAEKSVLVDVMHRPDRLFPEDSESRVGLIVGFCLLV